MSRLGFGEQVSRFPALGCIGIGSRVLSELEKHGIISKTIFILSFDRHVVFFFSSLLYEGSIWYGRLLRQGNAIGGKLNVTSGRNPR